MFGRVSHSGRLAVTQGFHIEGRLFVLGASACLSGGHTADAEKVITNPALHDGPPTHPVLLQ